VAHTTVKILVLVCRSFGALVKRWDKCMNVGGAYIEKYMFFSSSFEYHIFYVLYPFVTYLLTLPRINEYWESSLG
jgi:hypothetical protein